MTRRAPVYLTAVAALVVGVIGTIGAFRGGDGPLGAAVLWLALAALWGASIPVLAHLTRDRDPAPPFRGIPPPPPDAQWWRDADCPITADVIQRGHHKEGR